VKPINEDEAEILIEDHLRELSAYYVQTRYPEEIKDLASQAKKEEARRVLDHTEEVLQWLSSML